MTGALVLGASGLGALPAHADPGECETGSRDINISDAIDVYKIQIEGGRGYVEITLRSNDDGTCHWALIAGPGEVFLQTQNQIYPDQIVYGRVNYQKNKDSGVTHTAAVSSTQDAVRACGRAFDGEESDSSSFSVTGGADGKTPSGSISGEQGNTDTYALPQGVQCTEWHLPDTLVVGY